MPQPISQQIYCKMTKKNSLLAALALLSVCALYAFAYPEVVRENVLTILFPDGERPCSNY
jgi:hypothetical protein